MKKKLVSLAMALTMVLALLPMPASAAEATIFDWITVSDLASSDEYTNIEYPALGPVMPYFYYIGDLVYSDGISEFCGFFLPSNATVTLQASNYIIRAEWLNKLEGDRWGVQRASEKVYAPASGSDTWDRARFEDEFPGATYVTIGLGTELVWGEEIPPMSFMFVDAGPGPETPPAFTDVPEWCAPAVGWAVDNGITNGTGDNKFSPNDTCKNTEILTFLWRAADKPTPAAPSPFTVASYYQDAVDWAYGLGMIDDAFVPDAYCTRAGAVYYIWQALDRPPAGAGSFVDVPAGAFYAPAAAWAAANGIAQGYGNNDFRPANTCTRGEIVTLLHRAYVPSVRLPAA